MRISLLLPSRKRVKSLLKILENINNTVNNTNNIEILIAIDRDDESSMKNKESIIDDFKNLNIKIYTREHSDYLNSHYYNWLAEKAIGNYLWGIADDTLFLTKDWDKKLIERIEAFLINKEDRIAYISINEKDSNAKHPCFPLITKEAFKIVGEYHISDLMSWGSDRILYEIYSHPNIMRILHISEVSIEHLSYHDGTAPFDETAKSMKERFFRDPDAHNRVSLYSVPQYRKKIENYIKEFNNGVV